MLSDGLQSDVLADALGEVGNFFLAVNISLCLDSEFIVGIEQLNLDAVNTILVCSCCANDVLVGIKQSYLGTLDDVAVACRGDDTCDFGCLAQSNVLCDVILYLADSLGLNLIFLGCRSLNDIVFELHLLNHDAVLTLCICCARVENVAALHAYRSALDRSRCLGIGHDACHVLAGRDGEVSHRSSIRIVRVVRTQRLRCRSVAEAHECGLVVAVVGKHEVVAPCCSRLLDEHAYAVFSIVCDRILREVYLEVGEIWSSRTCSCRCHTLVNLVEHHLCEFVLHGSLFCSRHSSEVSSVAVASSYPCVKGEIERWFLRLCPHLEGNLRDLCALGNAECFEHCRCVVDVASRIRIESIERCIDIVVQTVAHLNFSASAFLSDDDVNCFGSGNVLALNKLDICRECAVSMRCECEREVGTCATRHLYCLCLGHCLVVNIEFSGVTACCEVVSGVVGSLCCCGVLHVHHTVLRDVRTLDIETLCHFELYVLVSNRTLTHVDCLF